MNDSHDPSVMLCTTRGRISQTDCKKLCAAVDNLLSEAITSPQITRDLFEQSLTTPVLYPKYGVTRTAKPRGRPKKAVMPDD